MGITNKTDPWTISIFPTNRTGSWLAASQYAGTGPAQIVLTASGAGFEPGAYQATIVVQSPNAIPQTVAVPVMFVLGGSTSGTAITRRRQRGLARERHRRAGRVAVGLRHQAGKHDRHGFRQSAGVLAGWSDGDRERLPAPILSLSPGQIDIQIPFAAGAGPAVLGIDNNGQVAGFPIQLAAASPGIFTDAGATWPAKPLSSRAGWPRST